MYNVLMVCTGNICRSPMAAGLLTHQLPRDLTGRVLVGSAGCHALHGHQAEPFAVDAMALAGIDITNHRARQITPDLARSADLILAMEYRQRDMVKHMLLLNRAKVRLLTDFNPQTGDPEVLDPYGGPPEAYLTCLQTLQPCIGNLIDWLSEELPRPG